MSIYGSYLTEANSSDDIIQESIVEGILAAILAAQAAIIFIIIKKMQKQNKDIKNYFNDPEVKKQFKIIHENTIKVLQNDKNVKKYEKYITYIPYTNKNKYFLSKDNTTYTIATDLYKIDVEKIFKDGYNMTPLEYTKQYNEDQPDNCKPAPKFVKVVKNIEKAITKSVTNIKSSSIRLNSHIEDDDEQLNIFYDSYIKGRGNEDLKGFLYFNINYKELLETVKDNKK